jgi:hypothetical protein
VHLLLLGQVSTPDKRDVLCAIADRLAGELGAAERAAAAASSEVTSEEAKAESKYDTRSTEASYLARGQAERVAILHRSVSWFRGQARGSARGAALLKLCEDGQSRWVLLAPMAGGQRVRVGAVDIVVVTRHSPIGQALEQAEPGEEATWRAGGRVRVAEIEQRL